MARRERVKTDEALEYGLWWLSRWISGSMRDPDWSWPEAETLTPTEAFAVLRDRIGVTEAVMGPFWRYLDVPGAEADRLLAGGELLPHDRSPFQSFTTERRIAEEFAEFAGRTDHVGVVVRVDAPADLVAFGMRDLQADRRAAATLMSLDLWHHQDEIVVLVDRPLRVLEAHRVGPSPDAEPGDERDHAPGMGM